MNNNQKIAIVTGGASGIGKAIAHVELPSSKNLKVLRKKVN